LGVGETEGDVGEYRLAGEGGGWGKGEGGGRKKSGTAHQWGVVQGERDSTGKVILPGVLLRRTTKKRREGGGVLVDEG